MSDSAIFHIREIPNSGTWVVDATWADRHSEQLVGVYTSRQSATDWIRDGAATWRRSQGIEQLSR
jgi:hypothetical protein